jgi:thiol-disulfide isomerase/thioredoxin
MASRVRAEVRCLLAAGLCLLLSSCARSPSAAATPQPSLQPLRFDQWQQQLVSFKGQIVVVDVWATWCAPCIERFPHMVQLYQQYKDRGVTFVSMDVDDREDKQAVESARRFLRQQNATFRNYLMDENIMQSFEKLGVQGIPAVFIYDRTVRQRYNLNGNDPNHQFTVKDVDDALARLVAEP